DYRAELKLMVVPEENALHLPSDPFTGQAMVVSVFAKGLYRVTGMRPVDPNIGRGRNVQQYELRVKRLDIDFDNKLKKLYESATENKLWKGTPAAQDRAEYWAAGVDAYFAGAGRPPIVADRPMATREALKAYDPDLYALVDGTMAYKEQVDWRYKQR